MAETEFSFDSATDVDAQTLEMASRVTSEQEPPELDLPGGGPVTLPVGFRRVKSDGHGFEDIRQAWVRELNGEDEERIATARLRGNFGAYVSAVLERGVERLGDHPPTKDDLNGLVVGDQQYLLLEISRATYGDELEYENFQCNFCGEVFNVSLSLSEDIPVRKFDSVDEGTFEVVLRNGRVATMSLPTGAVNQELSEAETGAHTNTLLIANSVEVIRGPGGDERIAGDLEAARKIGAQDRRTLVSMIGKKMPGPQYNEVTFTHETDACGKEIRLDVTLADLFREE